MRNLSILSWFTFLSYTAAHGTTAASATNNQRDLTKAENGSEPNLNHPHQCGTTHLPSSHRKQIRNLVDSWTHARKLRSLQGLQDESDTAPIVVNVVAHVIQYSPTTGLVDDALINDWIAQLNAAFADTAVQFQLEDRTTTTSRQWFLCTNDNEAEFKSAGHVGGNDTLNIYLCQPPAGMFGWATPPSESIDTDLDGIVMFSSPVPVDSRVFFNQGDTLIHLVGEWLGLSHTYEGGCTPGDGDFVRDTPAHNGPTWSSGFPDEKCWTDPPLNSCPDDVVGVDPGSDPTRNYMNDLPASCRSEFTPGQVEYMQAQWQMFRAGNNVEETGDTTTTTGEAISVAPSTAVVESLTPTNSISVPAPTALPSIDAVTTENSSSECAALEGPCVLSSDCCSSGVSVMCLQGKCAIARKVQPTDLSKERLFPAIDRSDNRARNGNGFRVRRLKGERR